MLHNSLQFSNSKKFIKLVITLLSIATIVIMMIKSAEILVSTQSSKEIILNTQYQITKQKIEARRAEAQQKQSLALDEINKSQDKQQTLTKEIEERRAEIEIINSQIIETQQILEEIRLQKLILEDRIDRAENDLGEVVIEIQDESRIPFIEKLFSSSIADGLKRMNYLNTLNEEAQTLINQIEKDQKELEENERAQEETKAELENSQALAESKKSSLEVILEITKGEQAEYENLLRQSAEAEEAAKNDLIQENTAYNFQLTEIKNEEIRLAAIRKAEEDERIYQNSISKNSSNGSGTLSGTSRTSTSSTTGLCYFEVTAPSVPSGFFQRPASGRITNPIQCRSSYSHDGLDIAAAMGTPLYSIGDGRVARVGPAVSCIGISCNGGFGNYIVIEHTIPSGRKLYSLYAHMRYGSSLTTGQTVSKGQQVGQMGCTGNTSPFPCGVHLHFMIIDQSISGGISCIYNSVSCINPLRVIDF